MICLLDTNQTKAALLERILKDSTSSYKYYWLQGLLCEIYSGNRTASFVRLASRMVVLAWYPVCSYHLSLGATDKLADLVVYTRDKYQLSNTSSIDEIVSTIEGAVAFDADLSKRIKKLTNYVPYRVIRPFHEEEVVRGQALLKSQGVNRPDAYADKLIIAAMRDALNRGFYSIAHVGGIDTVIVDESWSEFLIENRPVVEGWLERKIIAYLQNRNPSVPAISLKLHPPIQRDLRLATEYWRDVLSRVSLSDVYTKRLFDEEHFAKNGPLSVDHFIPWSFVMHDESWNLIPSFRNINSSKGDRLPSLNSWLGPFCDIQFEAIITLKGQDRFRARRHYLDSYRSIDPCIDEYVRSEVSRIAFSKTVGDVVKPLWQIAFNQGYSCWDASSITPV